MAAQVCLHWRDHGIDHPTFWKNIEATSPTAGALDMLAARLGQSCGRPFSLTIDIEAPLRPTAENRLMQLITAIMPTVQKLDIRLNAFCMISLWPVLNWDAPELTTFSLRLYNPDRIMARVPVNWCIFDSLPGKLREVTLEDVILPDPIDDFPAFSQLHKLTIIHPPATVTNFPARFLEICRNLHTLVLRSGRLTFEEQWSTAALEGLSRLTWLVIDLDPLARDEFVARMPLMKHIPSIVMLPPPDIDAAYNFLVGVGSPFNVGLIFKCPNEFCVIVEDDRSGYIRVFIEFIDLYERGPDANDEVNILLENDEFPKQVESLSVSLCLWDLLVPYMSYYAGLAKLVISLATPDPFSVHRLDGKPLAFVALEVLVIEALDAHYAVVRPGDVIHFVDQVLQASHCRKLELRRVLLHWQEDAAPLYKRFDHNYRISQGSKTTNAGIYLYRLPQRKARDPRRFAALEGPCHSERLLLRIATRLAGKDDMRVCE
ncbi:hypothetical protein AURDEDRAFT_153947 [Auricularia subglabra TFB-10046 SS5]|uniref:F-box domain-containing protein n=1 Tax=Auricularia subglabra (strain TFB-10046 / SS5) TaxID=717982 RepID=J0D144_AURST|nr:hypothetical protein AURDEDRAFT_153947 [Auricularia subglabra TFB-10046 SS5]